MGVRALVRVLAAAGLAVALVPGSATAQSSGFERIRAYDVEIDVLPSGRMHVVETIDYSFGALERHGIFRTIPVRFRYDGEYDRVYPLRNVRVTGSPGTPVDTDVSDDSGSKVIKIGDPDRTISGDHRYVIAYDVDGGLNRFEGHDELYWNAIGHEWGVSIERATVTVRASGAISEVTCFAGSTGSGLRCERARASGTTAVFGHGRLLPYQGLTIVAALPAGYAAEPGPILRERWSFRKAFAPTPISLGLSGLVLLGGLAAVASLVSRTGRDRRYSGLTPGLEPAAGENVPEQLEPVFGRPEVSVDFDPGEDMRPALMGVLLDERADPLDVTATIVDLAVRRYLTIEELPRKGLFRRRDWKLTRLNAGGPELTSWERRLLNALFASGHEVELSDLKNEFHTHLAKVQEDLYEDVVARGWFTRSPDSERGKWRTIGLAGLGLAGGGLYLLARFTRLGLVGVALVLVALVFYALHKRMPFRTARGTAALDRVRAFRRYLVTAESNQLRFEESEGIFARYLPYAVVLGETERWARAFRDLGSRQQQELYWYTGPSGWSANDFSDSMSSFAVTSAGTLAATPQSASGGSGFSGGSSGGGGGGGGGGSW